MAADKGGHAVLSGSGMKILGHSYKLRRDLDRDELGAAGRINTLTEEIFVAEDLNEANAKACLIHEILEGIDYYMDLKLDHKTISQLEAGFYAILTDNGIDLKPLFYEVRAKHKPKGR